MPTTTLNAIRVHGPCATAARPAVVAKLADGLKRAIESARKLRPADRDELQHTHRAHGRLGSQDNATRRARGEWG